MDGTISNNYLNKRGLAKRPLARGLMHLRTPDEGVCSRLSLPGGWVGPPFVLQVSVNWQSCDGTLYTAMPYPPLPGQVHTGGGRDALPLQAPLIAWIRSSLPSALDLSCPFATGLSEFPGGPAVTGACALGGRLSLPQCLRYTRWPPWCKSTPLPLQEIFDTHRVFGLSRKWGKQPFDSTLYAV